MFEINNFNILLLNILLSTEINFQTVFDFNKSISIVISNTCSFKCSTGYILAICQKILEIYVWNMIYWKKMCQIDTKNRCPLLKLNFVSKYHKIIEILFFVIYVSIFLRYPSIQQVSTHKDMCNS